ncbi:MAG: hypothetical protein WAX80_03325 [Minisyncoccia bacterium]
MSIIEVDALANVHCHLREGELVGPLIELAIEGGADCLLPMPNTKEGLLTARDVIEYMTKAEEGDTPHECQLIPTVMINERTTIGMIDDCAERGIVDAKIYPLDRTTKSHNGVRDYSRLLPVIRRCGECGIKVHLHPEHPWMLFDNRDAEFAFLPIVDMFLNDTDATIIWEHGTDGRCIPFWKEMVEDTGRFYLTLTAHHLASDEDRSFGDVRAVCKPPIKTRRDQSELVHLVEEGNYWVMAGLDDAPHDKEAKHISSGNCACGAYTAPFGLQLYAHALDDLLSTQDGVSMFVDFTSRNARRLHKLANASRTVGLTREPFVIPASYVVGPWVVEPFWANTEIKYSLGKL